MKKVLTINTRWEYYASNIAGFLILTALMIWCVNLSFKDGAINFTSMFFWMALLLLIIAPFAIITFFSSMKSVVVTQKGLLISYTFKRHKNEVNFSAVTALKSSLQHRKTAVFPSHTWDSFKLTLADGRIFEFSRSQFDDYSKLKAIVFKAVTAK
jgi:hypothetical protein